MMLVVVRVGVCVHIFMLFHFACLASHSCHPEESSALLHLRTQLITNTTFYEDNYYVNRCPYIYPKMRMWANGTDCCSWMGVTCDSLSGHVIGLDLSCSGLVGHQFPWHQFQYLDLSFNLMDDDISSFFCNTTSLEVINLSHNRFTGTFPQCLANCSYLTDLDLQMNNLHDTLPDIFKHLDQLETLNLNGNQFKGLLPKSLSNSINLVDLDLGNNQFEDTFPNWLQNLSTLEILVLRGNKLYGPIANLKSENIFPILIIFDISCNNLSGSLPKAYIQNFQAMKIVGDEVQRRLVDYIDTSFGAIVGNILPEYDNSVIATVKGTNTPFAKIPTTFVNIDLSENKFEGEIPDDFGELHGLIGLNLSHNRLVGNIPHSLGNLTNLESLDLSSNMLTGDIPTELANLNFLEVLNLSQNQLVGPIPRGKQFDTFSNNSYEGNMGLCGLPLSVQCNNNVPLQQYPPSSEAEDKFGFGWKPVAIGYACGMVLGIGLGFYVFSIGKPQWLVIMFGGKRIKRRRRGNRRARTT
ncbi:receptor-like protein 9DC3 isoform X2 [Arachis stenosperma]|uniref:receptor-like protein 9DC3 isoform X2 n=1 Tax=Arachis stenosperma TaxID=217475 RepID=UPI0025ACA56C|nr:receptor-like protein 9DC3 isoform X2 [Arachis stenosperma]